MAVQTTYSTHHEKAYLGMIADLQIANTVSGLNTDTETIPYGRAVIADPANPTVEDAISLTNMTNSDTILEFRGILVRELNQAYKGGETFGLPVGQTGSVLTFGVIWVPITTDVTKDTQVFVIGGTPSADKGKFTNVSTAETFALSGAQFVSDGLAGGMAKISIGVGG